METPLRVTRLRLGRTLLDVAEAVGSDTGNISRIEFGQQTTVEMAEKIARYFKNEVTALQILHPFAHEKLLAGAKR